MEFKKSSLNKFEYELMEKLILIDKNNFNEEGKILFNLQISGGLDSMCLLNAFAKILYFKLFKPKNQFVFIAQHFNHKKRGLESDEDAAFVIKNCLSLGIPIYQELFDNKYSEKENFQDIARNWRKKSAIELCLQLRKDLNCKKFFIVTAHHARDHVETVLMHLIRGCSLNGLLGIQEFDNQKIFYRPFFNTEYEKIVQYGNQEKIKFRQDSSNLVDDYDRNYIRNQIIPHFKKMKDSYEKSFCNMSNHVSEYLQNFPNKKDFSKSGNFIITENMSHSEVYDLLLLKNKEIFKILTKNVIKNILHEMELMKKSNFSQKEIMLAQGWIVQLVKGNNNIEIDVFQKKTIK
ncbi:tRNA lysidine(34) synthetase TilS [Silvanigrella sp.]|jgi:tRNA(Ile)-lysidine synthetase-like protein|uniref:tRNA lysidine(34) synthetase TilS n=1 Tax=Silvanigrella sp. TaxID=2024976 RepID=UPI0037CB4571